MQDHLPYVWITWSRVLATKLLKKHLLKHDYIEVDHTPGHFNIPLGQCGSPWPNGIKAHYYIETDWTGGLYCGITLKWNQEQGYVDISMPSHVNKNLISHQIWAHVVQTTPVLSISARSYQVWYTFYQNHIWSRFFTLQQERQDMCTSSSR